MRIAKRIGSEDGRARLSSEKLYDLLKVRFVTATDLAALDSFELDQRHVTPDKQALQSPVESGGEFFFPLEC